MQAKEVKDQLKFLISEASSIDPSLEKRLDEVYRWIKDKKNGLLNTKKPLMAFLLELINDAEVWLELQLLTKEEQQAALNLFTPPVRYWYSYLFPKWLNELDPKLYKWKPKMMGGQFTQEDAKLLTAITNEITSRQGSVLQRYVADLSMATDLIVSGSQEQALCIQFTSISEEFSDSKYQEWKTTLFKWSIDRGLFLSFDPSYPEFIKQLVNIALYNSNNLKIGSYLKFSVPS
ncbi:hypothetical protein ANA_P10093 (plasmid) [Anabaena sp. 90]|uniref:hypothetical protein n=1 Tax=Anabaena sp. 90 TaxID=46234 RepID=UPI00029B718D|nr:hypothetical protein [Anabaena sp. 90]AFW97258.1 hypothetical protein ANA_P10093 [Anabaena sp. 90]